MCPAVMSAHIDGCRWNCSDKTKNKTALSCTQRADLAGCICGHGGGNVEPSRAEPKDLPWSRTRSMLWLAVPAKPCHLLYKTMAWPCGLGNACEKQLALSLSLSLSLAIYQLDMTG